ncbi:MAG: trypsin-like peptidase domain-containing protein [Anaerolineales bacterium]
MNKGFVRVLIFTAILMLTGMACQTLMPSTSGPTSPVAMGAASPPVNSAVVSSDLIALYQQVSDGVVSIRVISDQGSAQGSGFVYDAAGHIITNYHVIEGAQKVEVDFLSGFKAFADVIGTDLDSDLAVLQVDAPADVFHPIPLADSDQVQVGQTVVAIGNPFGYSGTMTVGIISGKGRTLDSMRESSGGGFFSTGDILQTDAAINPGNSGGPLLNLNGEVVGINRAIQTTNFTVDGTPTNSGVGFAVAANIVRRVAPALISSGKYDYPYLGISALPEITLISQQELGLPQAWGVYVSSVAPDSPAEAAGIQEGDIITAMDGKEVRDFGEMISYLFKFKQPGDTVQVSVLRDGRTRTLSLTLGKRP